MVTFKATDLVGYSMTEMETLPKRFNIEYTDGTIVTEKKNATILSWLFWAIYKQFPADILPTHHITNILGGKQIMSSSHLLLMHRIYVTIMLKYGLNTPIKRIPLTKSIVNVFNDAYNELLVIGEQYMSGIDITDFTQITNHPVMEEIYNELEPTQKSIDAAYAKIKTFLTTGDLGDNFVAKSMKANFISTNQILQCIGPRGFLTDVDSSIFPNPILRSYTHGMRSLHDSLIESRSAAKALYYTKSPLEQTEYASRRFSLIAMTIKNLHFEDCGSTHYLDWFVRPKEFDADGTVSYGGDLDLLQGKYYLTPDGKLDVITKAHTHLIGTHIKMRSVIAGCNHTDPNGVCVVCFGELGQNLSPYANLGHHCAANLMQIISQIVLSTKHYDGSSKTDDIQLGERERIYFTTDSTRKSYVVLDKFKKMRTRLVVNIQDAISLNEISIVEDVNDLPLTRISGIQQVGIEVDGNVEVLNVKQDSRKAVMTHEFLNYIKLVGYTSDNNNYYFDLAEWDYTKPILTLPDIAHSMLDHAKDIAEIIESKLSDVLERSADGRKMKVLLELFELVNSKIAVNLSFLEIILYATMVNSIVDNDFRLPKNGEGILSVASLNISRRSLGAALAYEGIYNTLTSPYSHFYPDEAEKPSSPMDVFLSY